MPILPAESEFHPPELWDRALSETILAGDVSGPRWWCLHTKPRQEKTTSRYLVGRGLAFYLPQYARESRTPAGRKLRSILPLFPSYLFVYGDDRARLESLKGNTLVQVLEVADQRSLDHDLRQIRRMLASGLPVAPAEVFPVGSAVRISTGPLMGLEGVVVRRDKEDRFVAFVQFLRSGAAVELRDWQVEPIQNCPAVTS